jgi:predicted transposase YbfD/YdcC
MDSESSGDKRQRAIAGISRYFGHLPDRRQQGKTDYPLLAIIAIVLLGTLASCDGWAEIASWAEMNADRLRPILDLGPEGDTPCETTLARVFARLEPNAFRDAFFAWAKALNQALREQTESSSDAPGSIAIDGKALRRALKRAGAASPMMLVSAFATDNHLVLGAVRTEDKSNEITAVPALLDLLDLDGALVTMDAAGTQTANTDKIVAKNGDYILALKGNQSGTHHAVGQFLLDAAGAQFESTKHREHCTEEDGHGRHERRRVVAVELPDDLMEDERWAKLNSIIYVERERTVGATAPSIERHFYLSSLPYTEVRRIATAIRAHWSIENNLHWVLDTQFREDESQIGEGFAPENLAMVRRFTLNCLKQRRDVKGSMKWKAKRCFADFDFLIDTLVRGLP